MAYVVPSGIIQLFRGINLDNRYMHTIYFASETIQNTWFSSRVNFNYTAQMYTRHNSNTLKLKVKSDVIANCTYMRFQNEVGGKWYYAFVNATNYINENTTEVVFEIDIVQTWFIQGGSLLPCYVERQHVSNDTFGINLEAEPVGSEAYDLSEIDVDGVDDDFGSYQIVINTTEEPTTSNMIRDGIVVGTNYDYIAASSSAMGQLKNKMITALGSWDKNEQKADIVDLFMFPTAFTFGAEGDYHSTRYHVYHDGKLSNYTPKNNKLFAYPYSQLYVTTCDGDTATYRWEYFEGDITSGVNPADFDVNATLTGGGMIEMHPTSYNGVSDNFDSKIVMNNFPKCSWNYDAYQAWVANGGQYKSNYESNMIQKKGALAILQGALNGVSSLAGQEASNVSYAPRSKKHGMPSAKPASAAIQAAATGASAVLSIEETSLNYTEARDKVGFEFKDARYEPNIIVGQQVPNISVGYRYLKFRFFNMHVRDDEAKRIDDFFSVYGYAINKVVTPNLTGRKHWNFIKTKNAQISGNMPASAKAALARIFDGGIFFWRNGEEIGNFNIESSNGSIDNPII